MSTVKFIRGGRDGWLKVKREPSGIIVPLCEHTKVNFDSSKNGRDFFSPTEGAERDKEFSVIEGNLNTQNPGHLAAATLRFDISKKKITFPGGSEDAITHSANPIGVGVHPIQIPDFPHAYGEPYMNVTPYAKNWFYLGQGNAVPGNNDRYLHPGAVSAGCITVDPLAWTRLYKYLILCRANDGKTVGTITVHR